LGVKIKIYKGGIYMSYKDDLVKAFKEDMEERGLHDESILKVVVDAFSSGFELGSLNGASDEIKEYAVRKMRPVKDKKAKEIIEKLRDYLR
jgi:hypothetical protein